MEEVPEAFEGKSKGKGKKQDVIGKVPFKKGEKQEKMIAALKGQPKKTLYIPLIEGQAPDYTVKINGIEFYIPCGEEVTVPEQVHEIMMERMNAERRIPKAIQELARKALEV